MSRTQDRPAGAEADTKLTVLVNSAPGFRAVETALTDAGQISHIQVLHRCDHSAANAENLLVFAAASQLDHVRECVSVANKDHRLAALLVYNDVASDWLLYMFYRSGLRALRNTIVHSDPELPTRVLSAWALGAEHDFIADAAAINHELVVRSCAFEELSIPFDAFPALRAIPGDKRADFVVEEGGLLLHWPEFRVHLDLDDIRFANDPKRQTEMRAASIGEQLAIGGALRRLREEAGLKQSDIAAISERQVRRVESGDRLTTDTLDAFAQALGIDVNDLLEQLGNLVSEPASEVAKSTEVGSPPGPGKASAKRGETESIAYRSPGPSHKERSVGEVLQLAASSTSDLKSRWQLHSEQIGVIRGVLEHDVRKDGLYFVIEATDISVRRPMRILVLSSRLAAPLVSSEFVPSVGTRVFVASGQGIVPSDVSGVELRTDEP